MDIERRSDPRHGQILTLGRLLIYGLGWLGFDLGLAQVAVTLASALAVQRLGDAWTGAPWQSGAKSALISALSLCLLLRTDALWLAAVGSAIAVGSKFVIRVRGKHVFNPTNGALVALLLTTDLAWVSPGQWGTAAAFAFAMACAGMLVVNRAARSDVTLAFIGVVRGAAGRPVAVARRANDHPAPPAGERCLPALQLLHDLRPEDHARLADRPHRLRDAGRRRRLVRALPAVPSNGFLWALAAASPLVPVIDWLVPGGALPVAAIPHPLHPTRLEDPDARKTAVFLLAKGTRPGRTARAEAFCGFYVAKADTSLFNKASQVVLVRDGDRTVITMANDFRGNPREFAMVIPVPTSITREQIHVAESALVKHLDAYTAPRLVEYLDPDPCAVYDRLRLMEMAPAAPSAVGAARQDERAKSLGVTIEALLHGRRIRHPHPFGGAELRARDVADARTAIASRPAPAEVLASYIGQKMRFFVAKVNLAEQAKLGVVTLRPIQVAYESPKFMLPIRLGMVNADGTQELFVYTLTRKGRVESTNYRTVKLATDVEIPTYVKEPAVFSRMYRALFDAHVKREDMRAVFQEYAWDMGWCDPCASDPLTADELRGLGVFWLEARRRAAARRCADRPAAPERVRDAAARALRQGALPRGPGVPGDRRPHQLPGTLRAAARLDRHRNLRRR